MKEKELVLVIFPSFYGFSFMLFEGPQSPFDWGAKEVLGRTKNADIVAEVTKLLDHYRPDCFVLEDFTDHKLGRVPRIRRLYRALSDAADALGVAVKLYRREAIRHCFDTVGAKTKFEIAQAVARHIPALEHRLPPLRRAWMTEDRRQALFDAAALGITHYCESEGQRLQPSEDTTSSDMSQHIED